MEETETTEQLIRRLEDERQLEGVCPQCGWTNVYRAPVTPATKEIACPTCGTRHVLARKEPA